MYEGFENWTDVVQQFGTDEAEPDKVYVAAYATEGYEGQAVVIYRRDNKFYVVEGSHCSCMGLEDQWTPEEYDADTMLKVLARRLETGGLLRVKGQHYSDDPIYNGISELTNALYEARKQQDENGV